VDTGGGRQGDRTVVVRQGRKSRLTGGLRSLGSMRKGAGRSIGEGRLAEKTFASATRALEEVLDTLLNGNRVWSAEFLFGTFGLHFPEVCSFEVILRERRRFPANERDSGDPLLNFPYLSFEWRDGELHRFKALDEVNARVAELSADPDRRVIEHEKLVCFVPRDATPEFEAMVRTASRCLGVFYYACGAHDHFIGNVAARFARAYFKNQRQFDAHGIVRAVEQQCRVSAAYVNAIGNRVVVVADPSGIYDKLAEDERFRRDLQSSIGKVVGVTGQTATGYNYAVHTLEHEYFDHSRPMTESAGRDGPVERSYAYATRGVVVTACENVQLDLDVLSLTRRIFRAYVNDRIFSAREEFFSNLLRRGGRVADSLLVNPAETADQLRERLYPLLDEACGVLVQLTFASSVAIRAYDPFTQELLRVGAVRQDAVGGPEAIRSVPVEERERFASARAFAFQRLEGLDEGKDAPSAAAEDFGAITDPDGHVASIPIRVGAMVLGTVDLYTNGRRYLANDRQYLAIAADSIGELIRRIEAANDAAWLSRLSFLHSARHRLERFRRDVQRQVPDLASELEKIFRLYSSVDTTEGEGAAETFNDDLRAIMTALGVKPAEAERFIDQVGPVLSNADVPPLSRLMFREVMDNLLHNARTHAEVQIDNIEAEQLGMPGRPPSAMLIRYRDAEGPGPHGVLSRLCVSPILRDDSTTYRFGLFLLATQLRMAGGYASGPRLVDRPAGITSFEVTFGVPLKDLEGERGKA